MLGHVKSGFVR